MLLQSERARQLTPLPIGSGVASEDKSLSSHLLEARTLPGSFLLLIANTRRNISEVFSPSRKQNKRPWVKSFGEHPNITVLTVVGRGLRLGETET